VKFPPSAFLLALLLVPASAAASTKPSYEHYLKALLLSNQGSYEAALKEYEQALELDPHSAFMYQQAAELALEIGRIDKARELADRFSQLAPENPEASLLRGNVAWAQGDAKTAREAFEKAADAKGSPEIQRKALFALGSLLSAESPEKAKKYLERYLASSPENASEAEYQIALIEQRAERIDESARHLREALRLDPENMQARYTLAQLHEVRKDTAAALGVYEELLQRDPRNIALLDRIGEIHFLQEDPARAKEYFARAKAAAPDHPATCLWLALLAEAERDFAGAARSIRDSAALKDDAGLNLRLSYYLTQAGRLGEAVEALETARKRWPENEDISYFLALGYDDLKKVPQAIALLQSVLATSPDHRDARFQLGAVLERNARMTEAEAQFRLLLSKNPADAPALNYLGYSLADRGLKLEDAEALIRRAVELEPKNGAYRDSLGWVLFKRGRPREALDELQKALALVADDDAVWDHVGETYAVLRDTPAAWAAWRAAAAVAPAKPEFARKAEKVEPLIDGEKLGGLYMALFARTQGEIRTFGAPCAFEADIAGRKVRLQALVRFKAPYELSFEVLGPLFVPVFRAAFTGKDAFESDRLNIDGVGEEAARAALMAALGRMRDVLNGGIYAGPSLHRRWWGSRFIETPGARLYPDASRARLETVKYDDGLTMRLLDPRSYGTRLLPTRFEFKGRGFKVEFRFGEPLLRFKE
jgi:tetratricopeptide (TPR) repeat protein